MSDGCGWNNGGNGADQYRFECHSSVNGNVAIDVDEFAEYGPEGSLFGDIPCPGCRPGDYYNWRVETDCEIPIFKPSEEKPMAPKTTIVERVEYVVRRRSDKLYLDGNLKFTDRNNAQFHPSALCAKQRQRMVTDETDIMVLIEQIHPHG